MKMIRSKFLLMETSESRSDMVRTRFYHYLANNENLKRETMMAITQIRSDADKMENLRRINEED